VRRKQKEHDDSDPDSVLLRGFFGARIRGLNGFVAITVRPGRIEGKNAIGGSFVHTRHEVLAIRSRFLPWPGATIFVLTAQNGSRALVSPTFAQTALREAFAEAGFAVQDRRAWIVITGLLLWFPGWPLRRETSNGSP
jgi:hypothetical protein